MQTVASPVAPARRGPAAQNFTLPYTLILLERGCGWVVGAFPQNERARGSAETREDENRISHRLVVRSRAPPARPSCWREREREPESERVSRWAHAVDRR